MAICKACRQVITLIPTTRGQAIACEAYCTYFKSSGGMIVLPDGTYTETAKLKKPVKAYRAHYDTCPKLKEIVGKKSAMENNQ